MIADPGEYSSSGGYTPMTYCGVCNGRFNLEQGVVEFENVPLHKGNGELWEGWTATVRCCPECYEKYGKPTKVTAQGLDYPIANFQKTGKQEIRLRGRQEE